MDSIANQEYDDWKAVIVDDGSEDTTYAAMELAAEKDERFMLLRNPRNMGAAYSRFRIMKTALAQIVKPDDVFILLGMDDCLAHAGAIRRIDEEYQKGAHMTYGSYSYMTGTDVPPTLIEIPLEDRLARNHRETVYRLYPPQTFRADLAISVPNRYLKNEFGQWIKNCTEVALLFPILDIVDPEKIHFIPDTLQLYRHDHPWTTRERFGRPHKKRMFKIICAMPPLTRI